MFLFSTPLLFWYNSPDDSKFTGWLGVNINLYTRKLDAWLIESPVDNNFKDKRMWSHKFQQAVSELLLDLTVAQEVGFLCSSLCKSACRHICCLVWGVNPVVKPVYHAGQQGTLSSAWALTSALLPPYFHLPPTSALPVLKDCRARLQLCWEHQKNSLWVPSQ